MTTETQKWRLTFHTTRPYGRPGPLAECDNNLYHAASGRVALHSMTPPPPWGTLGVPGITYQQRALSFVALTVTEIH
jgi:hypothetical protein